MTISRVLVVGFLSIAAWYLYTSVQRYLLDARNTQG
jgi:hypothetical protein